MMESMEVKFTEKAVNDSTTTVERMISTLEAKGYTLQYNELTELVEFENGRHIDDADIAEMTMYLVENGYKRADINDVLTLYPKRNSYHPMRVYFNSLPTTTSTEHIDMFLNCLDINDSHITREVIKKWLVGCVAKLFEQHQNFALVLEGKGDIGKTTLCKWLAVNRNWYCSENPAYGNERDFTILQATKFIWELEELESVTSKKAAGSLKAFLTRDIGNARKAYGKVNKLYTAIANFICTVNMPEYLVDTSGNRRYFPVYVNSIDFAYHSIDKDAFWSEVANLYFNSTYDYILTEEEKAYQTVQNETKMMTNSLVDYLTDILEPSEDGFTPNVRLFDELREKGINVTTNDRRVKDAMVMLGYEQRIKKIKGKTTRGYSGCRINNDTGLTKEELEELYED
jgi:predicted P-loop ATPase